MSDLDDIDLTPRKPNVHAVDIVGVLVGLVPFALPMAETTSSYAESTPGGGMNIGTRTTKHMDYSALAGGGVAVVCALVGVAMINKFGSRPWRFAVFALVAALGGLQIARGVVVGAEGGTRDSGTFIGSTPTLPLNAPG